MDIIKKFMTKNRCYSSPVTITVKKLVLHSLGVAQPNSDSIFNTMNTSTASVSVHGFIEAERVIQTLPWNYRAWHVGSGIKGSYNSQAIGIEICEPKGHGYNGGTMVNYDVKANTEYFNKVYNNAVQLFAYLCEQFKLDPINDIVCHCEAYSLGYGSNHADVMHWFPKHGKSMDTFRKDVQAAMIYTPTTTITPKSSVKDVKWLQNRLNAAKTGYTIPVTGKFDYKTKLAVLIYADSKGWKSYETATGYSVGINTIKSLSKY